MKRLFSILVIFALFVCNYSLVFAEEMLKEETNTIEVNTVETTAEEQLEETESVETNADKISFQSKYYSINELITLYNEGKLLDITWFSVRYVDRKSSRLKYAEPNDRDLLENIISYFSFIEEFLDIATDNKGNVFISDYKKFLEKYGKNKVDVCVEIHFNYKTDVKEKGFGCKLYGNTLELNSRYAYVQNPEKAIDYVLESIENGILKDMVVISEKHNVEHIVSQENFRYDPVNYDTTAPREKIVYRLQDKMEFDIVPDESYYDTVFEEVGELGEPVHITIENIQGGTRFVLTIEGSKATKKFLTYEEGWEFDPSHTENGLVFPTARYIKGNKLYEISDIRKEDGMNCGITESPEIVFTGNVSDGEISTVKMKMNFPRYVVSTNVVSASDIQYTYYGNEKKYRLDEKVSLIRKFGIDRSAAAIRLNRQQGENFLEQDTENWKTDLRYEDDEVEFDFSVNYAAKVRLKDVLGNIPSWLKQLGKKPELTIIGLNTTCNGEENINYPIISFNGNGKTQWFAMSKMSDSQTDSSLDDSTIYVRFNSMKSFDNFVKIENLEDYYTVGMYLHYNKAGDVEELGSIDLVINENKTITVLADEIDSILGGEKIYESWM